MKLIVTFFTLASTLVGQSALSRIQSVDTVAVVAYASGSLPELRPQQAFASQLMVAMGKNLVELKTETKEDFDQLYDGNDEARRKLLAKKRGIRMIIVANLMYKLRPSTLMQHGTVCEMILGYRVVRENGDKIVADIITHGSNSFSEEEALKDAIAGMVTKFVRELAQK